MTLGLLPRQRDLLAFVRAFVTDAGYAPNYQEMADALGLRSRSGIHRLVHALVERSHLRLSEHGSWCCVALVDQRTAA